jgi:phospholipid/cholesterol/gamma-HCH transport system permease protein
MFKLIFALGKWSVDTVASIGELATLFMRCVLLFPKYGLKYRKELVGQLYFVGVSSIPVIVTTGAFAGAVFAYTLYNQLVALGVGSWAGAFMAKMLTWHFGPVLIGLVLAGRVGCAMTAELGTMTVTEQVDAIRSFGVSPTAYLVMPRVFAALVMAPVLTALAIFIGLLSGMFMIVHVMGGESHFQWTQIQAMMIPYDYVQGIVKGVVFGLIIALVCCRNGLLTRGGAEGVGLATTTANVSTCMGILIVNLFVSIFLTRMEPLWNELVAFLA